MFEMQCRPCAQCGKYVILESQPQKVLVSNLGGKLCVFLIVTCGEFRRNFASRKN